MSTEDDIMSPLNLVLNDLFCMDGNSVELTRAQATVLLDEVQAMKKKIEGLQEVQNRFIEFQAELGDLTKEFILDGDRANDSLLERVRRVRSFLKAISAFRVCRAQRATTWKRIGSDRYHSRDAVIVARSIEEMDPKNNPYPDHWQVGEPLFAQGPTILSLINLLYNPHRVKDEETEKFLHAIMTSTLKMPDGMAMRMLSFWSGRSK